MRRTMCKSKIHRGILTGADLHYEGSLTLDRDLMEAADLLPFEKVQVVNVNNGARLETYVIEGERGLCGVTLGRLVVVSVGLVAAFLRGGLHLLGDLLDLRLVLLVERHVLR